MKSCPKCLYQYSDDSLNFCLEDGTPLAAYMVGEAPTVSRSGREAETFVRPGHGQTGPAAGEFADGPRRRSPLLPMAAAALVSGIAVALIAGGIGAWLYMTGPDPEDPSAQINEGPNGVNSPNGQGPNTVASTPAATSPMQTPVPAPTTRPTDLPAGTPIPSTPLPPPAIDRGQAVQAVSSSVISWKSQAESRDLDSYMQNYAPTVHYYRKPGSSKAFVRSDKLRAFRTYNSMSIRITNMSVDVAASGGTATAVFDKEWVFTGSSRSSGKVRQQLKFQNSGGRWLITSERDIRVYYTN
ncbi:MAG: hypothetical protein IPM25_13750 [Chloracidobacterium sp.]|nr:hypothetical protein [Chloracidobacterium sp.]